MAYGLKASSCDPLRLFDLSHLGRQVVSQQEQEQEQDFVGEVDQRVYP